MGVDAFFRPGYIAALVPEWIPALEGVTAIHLINFDGTDGYAPLTTGADIVSLAAKAGVKRVTVLRGGDKGTVENALEASDLESERVIACGHGGM